MNESILLALSATHLRFSSLSGRMLLPSLKNTVHIDDLVLLVFLQQLKVVHKRIRNEHLDNCVPYYSSSSDQYARDVLLGSQRDDLECFSSELHDHQLSNKNTYNDEDEEIVIEEICEDIKFLFF